MKKVVSLVISLLLIIGIVPISASAETTFITQDGITYEIDTTTGEAVVYGADRSIVTADIPSEINGYPVTSIGFMAFYNCILLTEITIPDSVTSIDAWAFRDCTSLTSVTIPDSVTSIGYLAFHWCTSLTSVTIGDSVTSIGDRAFYNTAYYNDETNWENGVLYLGNYLIDANSNISGEYTIKDGTKVIADDAFSGCTSLTSVTIPDSVTSIGWDAFYRCTSLTSVTIPDSVTSIGGHAFYGCTSLTEITIGGSVTSIGDYAFEYCTSLTSVTIPDSVTSIGDRAFGYYYDFGYKKLENFTIYGYTGSAAETYANIKGFTFIDVENMPEPPTTQGDLNGDGKVSVADARSMLFAIAGGNADNQDTAIADFNGDGKLSIVDVRLLLVKIANGEV